MPPVYTALRKALFRLEETVPEKRFDGHDLECVALHPDVPNRVFCGTFDDGLYRSLDGGDTWRPIGDAIESDAVMSATTNPQDPDEVWVGTEPSSLYRSTDGGDSFVAVPGLTDLPSADEWYFPPRPETHHVRWIEIDPNDPDRVYVGIEAGAFVLSRDGGETWEERPPGSRRDNHSLAPHPNTPGVVYAAAGDGFALSKDFGESWDHPQSGLDHRYVWSVAVDPADHETVLVSAASGASDAHSLPAESYVYRRRGGDWERLDDCGLPMGEGVIRAVLSFRGPDDVYAANNRGLYRSKDAGDNWRRIAEWPTGFEFQTVRGLAIAQ